MSSSSSITTTLTTSTSVIKPPFYFTFPQLESTFVDIESRFAQIIYSYKNPFSKKLLPTFVQNVYEINFIIKFAINTSAFGETWNPQLQIMSDALVEILAYCKHYFNITPVPTL